jgi:hypothetical protein
VAVSVAENKALVRRYLEEAVNTGFRAKGIISPIHPTFPLRECPR